MIECACTNFRPEIPTRLPNQPRPRLGEHCQGGATKRKTCEASRFILDDLDRHSRAIQWTKRGAPELALAGGRKRMVVISILIEFIAHDIRVFFTNRNLARRFGHSACPLVMPNTRGILQNIEESPFLVSCSSRFSSLFAQLQTSSLERWVIMVCARNKSCKVTRPTTWPSKRSNTTTNCVSDSIRSCCNLPMV